MKSFTFFVPGKPRGKGRPRINMKTGRMYTPAATKQYESEVRQAFLRQGGESFGGAPLMVEIEAQYPMPKSWSRKRKDEARGGYAGMKVDIDNLAKVVLDSLTETTVKDQGAWTDDKSVVVLIARKFWSDTGGVKVTITDLSE